MMVCAGIAGAAIDEDRRDVTDHATEHTATGATEPQEGLAHAAEHDLGGAAR
jgi:hypothetical protein